MVTRRTKAWPNDRRRLTCHSRYRSDRQPGRSAIHRLAVAAKSLGPVGCVCAQVTRPSFRLTVGPISQTATASSYLALIL
jgi:hypothetical protein